MKLNPVRIIVASVAFLLFVLVFWLWQFNTQSQISEDSDHHHSVYPANEHTDGGDVTPTDGNEIVRQFTTRQSDGGYAEYTYYADGRVVTHVVNRCFFCHGSGICGACHGAGGTYNSYTQYRYTCTACFGKGQCSYCSGTGTQETTVVGNGDGPMMLNTNDGMGPRIAYPDSGDDDLDHHSDISSSDYSGSGSTGVSVVRTTKGYHYRGGSPSYTIEIVKNQSDVYARLSGETSLYTIYDHRDKLEDGRVTSKYIYIEGFGYCYFD